MKNNLERKTKTSMPRYRRSASKKPKLILQPRDIEIVKLVYNYRLLDSVLIRVLVSGSDRVLLSRLQKLYHNGYLDRIKRDMHKPIVYALGNQGADLLFEVEKIQRGTVNWRKKNQKIKDYYTEHTLQVSRFRAVLELALRNHSNYKLTHWVAENEIKKEVMLDNLEYGRSRATVIPDGFFTVKRSDGKEAYFFLEADRSTMTGRRFLRKMMAYWQFWNDKRHTERFGIRAFRVLTICKSLERASNLRELSIHADLKRTGFLCFGLRPRKVIISNSRREYSIKYGKQLEIPNGTVYLSYNDSERLAKTTN